jgi:hypothetical protein
MSPRGGKPARGSIGRSRRIQVTVTDAEHRRLTVAARSDGKDLAQYLREAGLEHADGGGILVPRQLADIIRRDAGARGMDAALLATLRLGMGVPIPSDD